MSSPSREPARRAALARWSQSTRDELERALGELGAEQAAEDLRAAETGLVMARGRVGGDGAPFNLGDVAVSRATVRLTSGEVGFGHVLGTDKAHARLCALCDALWQKPGPHAGALAELLERIEHRVAARRAAEAEEVAATRVDFFTLIRGEDD